MSNTRHVNRRFFSYAVPCLLVADAIWLIFELLPEFPAFLWRLRYPIQAWLDPSIPLNWMAFGLILVVVGLAHAHSALIADAFKPKKKTRMDIIPKKRKPAKNRLSKSERAYMDSQRRKRGVY